MTVLGWPLSQVVARLLMLLGPVLGVIAAAAADIPPPGWVVALVVGLAVAWVFVPESLFGTLCLAAVLGWWGVAEPEGLPGEALIAALGLLVAHLAALVVSYGPPEMAVDPATARLWLSRGALVFTAAPGVWALAVLLREQPEPPGVWIAAMVAIAIGGLVATLAYAPPQESAGEA